MDSSDSLQIDENLARFLAAYDQGVDGGDAGATTVYVPRPNPSDAGRAVTPQRVAAPNEGSAGEVLPGPERAAIPPAAPGFANGPHRIGRFELRRQLGKGGCGIVFLAYDPKLEREVALKLPRPEMLLNTDAKRRLIREALAAAEFDHPNLVPVYETGEIGPVCFIATAFCPGQTLAEWLDRQAFPVPVRQAARLVAILAEAVQHAHDRGVLHRDLKPNNVILQEMKVEENDEPPPGSVALRGYHFVPRLVDFGLAKLAERGGPSETATRQILGTPKYMAPEQAQARREDIGPTADVYALGVILYEMIAGRAPYDGATDVEVLRQSVEGKLTPPRHVRLDVPRDLEAICLKAMARNTAQRYRTAIDLADDLRRFLDGRPTVARPLAWSGRAVRWLRRNDQIVAIAALAVIAVFFTVVSTWNSYQSDKFRSDRDKALSDQAERTRADQQQAYSQNVRSAFLAWRSGNPAEAESALDAARRASAMLMEPTDFTHDYLARLVKARPLTIVCPAGAVTALGVSRDGTRLVSGHADGTVAVWDRTSGRRLGTAPAHAAGVTHVGFALGGKMLVTAGKEKDGSSCMRGWDVAKEGAIVPAAGDRRELGKDVYCFAVSPDGKTVYAGGTHGLLLKRNLDDVNAVVARAGKRGVAAVTAIAVSHDGKRVLTADTGVAFWTAGLRPDGRGDVFGGSVTTLAAGDAGIPAVGFGDGEVSLAAPVCMGLRFNIDTPVRWIATTADGNVALNSRAGRVIIGPGHDLATGDVGTVRAGAFAPDGKTLFTGSDDGVIRSWSLIRDMRDRAALNVGRVNALAVTRNGSRFVVADEQHHVTHYKGATEREYVESGQRPFHALCVQDDGKDLGVAFDGKHAVLYDIGGRSCTERFRVAMPAERTPAVAALSLDGTRLAVGDDAGQVTVWTVADRTPLGTVNTGLRRPVRRVIFSNDGSHFAVPTATGIGVWSVGKAEAVASLVTDDQAVFCLLSNERIVTAGRDGVVRVWTFAGHEDLALFGHVGRVTGLGVSPDGRTLVSGGISGEVKFWDLRTGRELLSMRRHSTPVTRIVFAANGKLLVTGGDGQVAVWDAR